MTWFKSLSFYRLGPGADAAQLVETLKHKLDTHAFQPPGGLEWFSQGWVPPADHMDQLIHIQNSRVLLSLQREDRQLSPSVISTHLDKKLAEIAKTELRKVARKEKLALKEQITDDLLPKAFTKISRTLGYFDFQNGWLIINRATATQAENMISALREIAPPLPASLPRTKLAPRTVMTDWLAAGEAQNGFMLDNDAVLADGGDAAGKIKITQHDLTTDEVRALIASGKQVTELALIWDEKIRFTLTDSLQLKKIQFLDVLQEEASQAGDDAASLFDATFLLMSEELGELVSNLVEALGGLAEDVPPAATAATAAADADTAAAPWDTTEVAA